ncbi:hypothetical protein V6N11_044500 [Hibiscus sabdariffa]|uniref:Retrovirus-related Pol polyprotein from transposon TNT 1-94 n=1 Tax=Hibiscus sabdariffa TaxID=183260 RepID=A0ABR2RFF1_9ROSI
MIVASKTSCVTDSSLGDVQFYRSIIGGLQYVCLTRPDITFVVNRVSQHMNNPLLSHWKAVKRILRYLGGTLDYGLYFKHSSICNLVCYVNADWVASLEDKRSTTGFCIFLGSYLMTWSSNKQVVASRSSSEA